MAIVGDAYVVVHAITTGFEREVRKGLSGINLNNDGRRVGESFSRGFSNGVGRNMSDALAKFSAESEGARRAFQSLVRVSYVVGPALAMLLSSVGALAGGFVSLVSAVGAAIPSLVVLPGLLTSIGLAAIVTKAAFSGVFNAIKAGTNAQKAAAKDTTAVEAAQKRLLRVMEQVTEAQDNLTEAMKRAKEEVQQLGFDTEDAALGEKKAAIELEKARETLMRVQDLPPNSRARREAQLAFAEAELNLRRAKDRNADLKKQQSDLADAAAKNGTSQWEQTQTYLDAKKQERNALRDLKDAQDDLAKAQKGGSADQSYENALQDLSPAAQEFVKYIVNNFIPALKELRDAAAEALLPLVQRGLEILRTKLFPVLKPLIAELATSVGKAFLTIVDAIVQQENLNDLKTIFGTAGYVVEGFGKIFANVYDSILSVLAAADPIIRRFTDFLVKKTGELAKFLDLKQASGELTAFFNKAGDIAAKLGSIMGNTFFGIVNIIRANFSPGGGGYIIIDWLDTVTAKFKTFSGSVAGQKALSDFFKGTATNSIAALSAIGAFIKEILKAGSDPNVKIFWDTLKTAAPAFGELIRGANGAGPALARLIKAFIDFAAVTLSTGAIQAFLDILASGFNLITEAMKNPAMKDFFNFAAIIFASFSALTLAGNAVKFFAQVVFGNIQHLMDLFGKFKFAIAFVKQEIAFMTYGMGLVSAPVLATVAAIAAIIAILVIAYNKSEIFREAVAKLVSSVGGALKDAFNTINDAIASVAPGIGNIMGVFKALGDFLGKYVVPILEVVLVKSIKLVAEQIAGVIRVVGLLVNAFKAIAKPIIEVFSVVISVIRGAINGIITVWNNTLGKIKITLPKILGFGGGTIGFPTIPNFAEGGIVSPSPTGTIARVAEAGRPERIEPLDPSGLSQRDRAIIAELNGNGKANDITFNIYPSQGMKEQELASIISRQIAFQLRRGGA